MRVTGRTRAVAAVAVARNVRLALDDDLAVAAVVLRNEEREEEGDEEEDAVPS